MENAADNPPGQDFEVLPDRPQIVRRRIPSDGGRKPGATNKLSRDIRETIKAAFYGAGGRRYLERVAVKRPDVFLALVGKVVPTETRVNVLASYQGIPVQVEDRDSLPALVAAPDASGAVLGAVYDAIGDALPTDTATPAAEDWLTLPSS